jgi:hypothetical protein
MQNKLRFIKTNLYILRKDWGQSIVIQHFDSVTVNPATGVQDVDYQNFKIHRAIVLPTKEVKKSVYDLVKSNFTYGGIFEQNDVWVIILKSDLPKYEIVTDDFVVIGEQRYSISSADRNQYGVLLITRSLANTPVEIT